MNGSSTRSGPALRIPRTIFSEEHHAYRDMVRKFIAAEVTPFMAQWEEAGQTPREIWLKAGAAGILGASLSEAYGGSGGDFLFDAVLLEELGRAGAAAPAWDLHSHIVMPYIGRYGTEAQKQHWLPKMASGEAIASIGMTEPNSGSDVQGVRTSAVRDGDHYVVNGSKTFITNGIIGDLIMLVVKTAPELGARGISLLLVDTSTPGYRKGRNLKKVGNKAQDTAELFFDDMRVPVSARLGEENAGWQMLMSELVQERLIVAVRAMAICEQALESTTDYTKSRKAFGRSVFEFQNTRFKLADMATETQIGRVFMDRCIEMHARGELDMHTAAMAKVWTTELQDRVLDACVQLHGGNGYMWEYPIARAWADARVHRIYAGTNEIMREIIGRQL
ncbi:MAG: acyl-CoA dehydrogenase family protein [Burkholderiales bacterium]|nr:acyl-CoA dehydrogenase family protein [Burkholderiales bacterium]